MIYSSSDEDDSLLFPVKVEDLTALDEDELHNLVLVYHVDCHVSCIQFRPHQCWAKYDTETLSGHQVLLRKSQNSENKSNINSEVMWDQDEVKFCGKDRVGSVFRHMYVLDVGQVKV